MHPHQITGAPSPSRHYPPRTGDPTVDVLPGAGTALGAGAGFVIGLAVAGVPGMVIGLSAGAAVGIVAGSVARSIATRRRGRDDVPIG